MVREFACLSLVPLLASAAFSQTDTPQFESADVHVSAHTPNPNMRGGGSIRGGRYEIRMANMVDLIRTAYGVEADKVLGGPSWLEWDRFDVIAKAPPATSIETARLMLQGLLADRFKLVVHKDTKPLASYALTSGKGKPKLKEADGSGETGCKQTLPGQGAPRGEPRPVGPEVSYSCHNMTMTAFAAAIRTMLAAPQIFGNNNPVLDQTDLKGSWDFNFKYSLPFFGLPIEAGEQTTFFDAMEKQLGFKLEQVKVPLTVIVVDSVNEKPTDNLPGVSQLLPVLPTEFEVADVRPSDPDFKGLRLQIQPSGRVNIAGMPLKLLVQQAWNITPDMLVGAPKWMDTDRFDIIAKMPEVYAGQSPGQAIDLDSVWTMLRALLTERFKLAVHMEDQPVNAYTLLGSKPKLKKADPMGRTSCKDAPGPGGNTALRVITCQNVTMAQFAGQLQRLAGGYIRNEVLDATGIDGAWDFSVTFSPAAVVQGIGARGGDVVQPKDGAPAASDPSGGISLFDALNKQLGLKLEMQKRPLPVLVIDHVEEKPADN
jgi:uncharacterized protein (TIGR03435 family)